MSDGGFHGQAVFLIAATGLTECLWAASSASGSLADLIFSLEPNDTEPLPFASLVLGDGIFYASIFHDESPNRGSCTIEARRPPQGNNRRPRAAPWCARSAWPPHRGFDRSGHGQGAQGDESTLAAFPLVAVVPYQSIRYSGPFPSRPQLGRVSRTDFLKLPRLRRILSVL
jgi:hypothetical protein